MGNVFSKIVQFFNKNLLVYLSVLLALFLFISYGVSRLKIDQNIYSVFPKGKEFSTFSKVVQENNLNKQIVFSINGELDDVALQLDTVAKELILSSGDLMKEFVVFREDDQQKVLRYFYRSFPALLTESDYQTIANKLVEDSIKQSIALVFDKMTSPNSLFLRKVFAKDPLGLAWGKLQEIKPQSDSLAYSVEDGILFSADKKRALFTAVLNFDVSDNVKNEDLNLRLEDFKDKINAENPDLNFDYFGTFQIAYENSRQVKEDTFLTMMISIALILLLLIIYYRSFLTPIFFVIPAIFSGLFGLAMVGFIQPEISAISIATSAVLMGIVLDYSFHFFTHYNHTNNALATIKELSSPMLIGSFTTVAAFTALIFTDSVVLQNFGLIALCTLSGAVFFTLLLLPTFLKVFGYKPKGERSSFRKFFTFPKWALRISIYLILGLTIFFAWNSNSFQFDADLNNLSFHPKELKEKEERFTGINPDDEKKVHLFVRAKSKKEAVKKNFELFNQLLAYKKQNGLEELLSLAPYSIPKEIKVSKNEEWISFWKSRKEQVQFSVDKQAKAVGFSETAFQPFFEWISKGDSLISPNEEMKLQVSLGLNKLIYNSGVEWSIVTSVVLKKEDLPHFKNIIGENEDVFILDISEMANALMVSVQDDFNYLLVFSSLLVFLSLLVIYGRIELALFAFLPMVISWVWILGICSIFGIEFNFVNIIVATFIFGLGDDFSIFVTDGLLQKYKTKSNVLSSFRSAIILSGITTIIGTGVLYFSKHPAIHSIAVISVVGIACIMLVTLFIQPIIFQFFITNRTEKRRTPVTFFGLLMSSLLFAYFFIGSILLTFFLPLLIVFPVRKEKKRSFLNYLVSRLAKSTIYLGFHIKKEYINKERLDFSNPSIIVANHSSFLDILLMIMTHPKVIIMVKKWVYNSPIFGLFIRYAGYPFIEEGTEYNLTFLKERIAEGYSIVIFPEGTRSEDGVMKRFHKGAFYLAQELKVDIQPILIIGASYVNPKNDFIIKSGTLSLYVMERISNNSPVFQERFGVMTKKIQALMRAEMVEARKQIEDARYWRKRVLYNYLYKGPVLEWYVRIKWRFEEKNYDFYDKLIEDRVRIYDVGCGLGYLSYFLHYKNPNRIIIGTDYDADKIEVAKHCADKGEQLSFEVKDAKKMDFETADVVFFNDVLHYLSYENQLKVLRNTVEKLTKNGLLIIRDGISDLQERHAVTEKTERYSTKIFGFNKTTEQLSFFSSKDIFNFAEEYGLSCEMKEQTSKTSNVLFILRKQ